MKRYTLILALALLAAGCTAPVEVKEDSRSHQQILFEDGNYAMFIHFGLYSSLEGEWEGKNYRGNAEWIMNPNQADIPVDEYMALSKDFNPSEFDAAAIVQLAKDAGMKYIVITSKHHEGFAMFGSDACDFNIKDATPFGRDVIGELADECHSAGIGIGFYYSQFQDWTAPGGGNGPVADANGRTVSFDEYFRTKCVPQVEEITTKYGEIELIWFDTPGSMDAKYSEELVALVHKNQPGCLVSSRVGNGLGDYETLGDMEIPLKNVSGLWEGIDVMQVGWGFNKEDREWKSPEYVVKNLIGTIARGGTFMMNIGPDAKGRVPDQAAQSLRKAGEWVAKYEDAVRAVDASPWGHALPWGDAVVKGSKLYLFVNDWPRDGRLVVPGLESNVKYAKLYGGKKLKVAKCSGGYELKVPAEAPDKTVSVIEIGIDSNVSVNGNYAALDGYTTFLSPIFADLEQCGGRKAGWMPRFGEWKVRWVAERFREGNSVTWTLDIPHEGYYEFDIEWKGQGGPVCFSLASDEGEVLTNEQPSSDVLTTQRAGWMHFDKSGTHTITLKISTLDTNIAVSGLTVTPVAM